MKSPMLPALVALIASTLAPAWVVAQPAPAPRRQPVARPAATAPAAAVPAAVPAVQVGPPPAESPPPGADVLAVLGAPAPEAQRASIDEAMRTLLRGRPADAVVALTLLVQRDGVDLRSYAPAAVALRLATSVATGAAQNLPLPPSAPAPAAQPGGLPPPPSDLDVLLRTIEGAMELAARRQTGAGIALVDSAVQGRDTYGAPYTSIGILRGYFHAVGSPPRVAAPAQPAEVGVASGGVVSGGPGGGIVAGSQPPAGAGEVPLPYERPAGTIDSGEAITLYVLGGSVGLATGIWAGLTIDGRDDSAARVTLPLLGVGGGVVAAALIDRSHGVRRGRVYAANAGFWLGLLAGGSLSLANDWELGDHDNDAGHAMMLGSLLGLGAGIGLGTAFDALPGSGSYVLSGGVWGWSLGLLAGIGADARDGEMGAYMLVGEAIGIAATLATAGALRPTPSQTRWLDAGAALGGLLGFSLAAGSRNDETVAIGSAVGMVLGGGLGLYFGRPSDVDREVYRRRVADRGLEPRLSVMPVRGGGLIQLGL